MSVHVTLGAVRERERESHSLKTKKIINNKDRPKSTYVSKDYIDTG